MRWGRPARPVRRADHGPLLVEEREHLRVGHPDLVAPAHGRDPSRPVTPRRRSRTTASPDRVRGRRRARAPRRRRPRRARARTSQSVPANGSSTTTAPSASSSATVRSSRAQRARSGENHTRAMRDAGTSPVRGQPSTSPSASISGRGSNVSSSSGRVLDAVEAEVAQVVLGDVERGDVPALAPVDERVGLDRAPGQLVLVGLVVLHPQPAVAGDGLVDEAGDDGSSPPSVGDLQALLASGRRRARRRSSRAPTAARPRAGARR